MFGFGVFNDSSEVKTKLDITLPKNFGQGEKKRIVVMFDIESKDHFSVIRDIQVLFELAKSFIFLYPSWLREELDDECCVVNKKVMVAKVSRHSLLAAQGGKLPSFEKVQDVSKRFRDFAFAERLDKGSRSLQVVRALSSATLAADTTNPETQLITLWSAFEALLPPPSKDEKSPARIIHFNNLVVPAIADEYVKFKFATFFRDLSTQERREVKIVLDQVTGANEYHIRLARALVAEELITKHIFGLLAASPLRCNRLYQLYKMSQNPKIMVRKIQSHESRISWKIHRIYRERNQIVHSGTSSPFLNPLVENSFLYFRILSSRLEGIYSQYDITNPHGALQIVSGKYFERNKRIVTLSNSKHSLDLEDRRKRIFELLMD